MQSNRLEFEGVQESGNPPNVGMFEIEKEAKDRHSEREVTDVQLLASCGSAGVYNDNELSKETYSRGNTKNGGLWIKE